MKRFLVAALLGFFVSPIALKNGGYRVQDVTNSGRSFVTLTQAGTPGVAAFALVTFQQYREGSATGNVSGYTPTVSSTFRVTSISYGITASTAAINSVAIRIFWAPAGSCTIASNQVYVAPTIATATATISAAGYMSIPFPEGIEFHQPVGGVGSMCIGMVSALASGTVTFSVTGYEYK